MENDSYKLFFGIIISGIRCFERYRQNIIRCINKCREPKVKNTPKVTESVIKNPDKLTELSSGEKMLSTSGLKAASIAYEMHNDRNSIDENVDYIIKALKKYSLWDIVNAPDNTKYMHRDIPSLLDKNRRINKKIIKFMDVMLSESEKEQFMPEDVDVNELCKEIKTVWESDYSWICIQTDIEEGLIYRSAKDIFRVIFDNLILNSIQQNNGADVLTVDIYIKKKEKYISIVYQDDGKGLESIYKSDPMRILEVHESSRDKGHGIGMWIVNNTIISTGGEIQMIGGTSGFKIEFILGDKI